MGIIAFVMHGQRIESKADNMINQYDHDRNGKVEYASDHPRYRNDRVLFQRADSNEDGAVTHSELATELRKYDTNGNGRISLFREENAMYKDLLRSGGEPE